MSNGKKVLLNILALIMKYDLIAVKPDHFTCSEEEKEEMKEIALEIKLKYLTPYDECKEHFQ